MNMTSQQRSLWNHTQKETQGHGQSLRLEVGCSKFSKENTVIGKRKSLHSC